MILWFWRIYRNKFYVLNLILYAMQTTLLYKYKKFGLIVKIITFPRLVDIPDFSQTRNNLHLLEVSFNYCEMI